MRHPDDPHRTILLADDNADALTLYGMIVQKMGYKVLKAQRMDHIYQILETELPDLVIVGTWIDARRFPEVVVELRQHPALGNIPLVVVTYIPDTDYQLQALESGADYVQMGIIGPSDLMNLIQSFVG
ncbi:MAG: response regulator [Anaerolineae bacterium]|nr:response regulator [Anaerolineae bacterium]